MLDSTRVPPDALLLHELLDEGLDLLDRMVRDYDGGDTILISAAAVTLRKFFHKTRRQVPLVELLEEAGQQAPLFTTSVGGHYGFSIDIGLSAESEPIGAEIVAPLVASGIGVSWTEWWRGQALSMPVSRAAGWQAGGTTVSRARLVLEWADRYGGAHVDRAGAERWLLDLIDLMQLGYWATGGEDRERGATLKWFDEPKESGRAWHPLSVANKALAHLVLARIAAETLAAYGRPTPASLPTRPAFGEAAQHVIRLG